MNDLHRSQFRLPYVLYDRIKAAAEANKRSINAEIVSRLEASFTHEDDQFDRLEKILADRDAWVVEEIKGAVAKAMADK
ncbi:MAG TPA: Arc family DNA-binding protein [Rhodocyclaceae bacterium]|nr:Arc family DNA-binding protein [Rhodocyclaceae bacterium]